MADYLAGFLQRAISTSTSLRQWIVTKVTNFPYMGDARFAVRSSWELALAAMLITPYMVFFYTLLLIAAGLVIIPLILLVLAGGAPADAYGLADQCRGKSPAQIRRLLATCLKGLDLSWSALRRGLITEGWFLAPAAIRHMRKTVVLQNILRKERVDIDASHTVLQRVISWLSMYGRPADVVLGVMDDKRLLAAAKSLNRAAGTTARKLSRAADEDNKQHLGDADHPLFPVRDAPAADSDGEQLDRVLPLRSVLSSLLVGLILSGLITAFWVSASRLLFPQDAASWLFPYAAVACLAGCVFLVGVQHAYPILRLHRTVPRLIGVFSTNQAPLRRLLRRRPLPIRRATEVSAANVGCWYEVLTGLGAVVVLYNFAAVARAHLAAGVSYPSARSDTPFLDLAAIAILTSKALVPSLVSRWRGSNLLYPTTPQLWRNRLWCLLQLSAGVVAFALFAHWCVV